MQKNGFGTESARALCECFVAGGFKYVRILSLKLQTKYILLRHLIGICPKIDMDVAGKVATEEERRNAA